jgi:hypothetical protein
MCECLGENDRRASFLRQVPKPWPRFFERREIGWAGEIALVTARHHTEAPVCLADIAQGVLDGQQVGVNLAVGDLIADPR